jgi:hypothetical protein
MILPLFFVSRICLVYTYTPSLLIDDVYPPRAVEKCAILLLDFFVIGVFSLMFNQDYIHPTTKVELPL